MQPRFAPLRDLWAKRKERSWAIRARKAHPRGVFAAQHASLLHAGLPGETRDRLERSQHMVLSFMASPSNARIYILPVEGSS